MRRARTSSPGAADKRSSQNQALWEDGRGLTADIEAQKPRSPPRSFFILGTPWSKLVFYLRLDGCFYDLQPTDREEIEPGDTVCSAGGTMNWRGRHARAGTMNWKGRGLGLLKHHKQQARLCVIYVAAHHRNWKHLDDGFRITSWDNIMLIHVLHGQVKTSFVKELSLEELRPSGRTSCFKPDGRGFGDLLL